MWGWILGSRTAVSVAITKHVTASHNSQTQTKTNSEWVSHVGSVLLIFSWEWCRYKCCHSSLPRLFANGWTSYATTPETLISSFGMRPRQDYTYRVMLNDCFSARCMEFDALVATWLSHHLETFGYKAQSLDTDRWLFFLTSVLPFPYFRFHTSAFSTCPYNRTILAHT